MSDPAIAAARESRAAQARRQAEQINQSADRMQGEARKIASKSLAVSAGVAGEIQENQWTRKLVESWGHQ